MQDPNDDIESLLQKIPGAVPEKKQYEDLQKKLAEMINHLINTNFDQLLNHLYRMDINEIKLRQLLRDNPGTEAGGIIAGLMIERQVEKIKSRQEFRRRDNNIDENEKW